MVRFFKHQNAEKAALAKAVTDCAWTGRPHTIANNNLDLVWSIRPDFKVHEEDLSFPVTVRMGGGHIEVGDLAILIPKKHWGGDS